MVTMSLDLFDPIPVPLPGLIMRCMVCRLCHFSLENVSFLGFNLKLLIFYKPWKILVIKLNNIISSFPYQILKNLNYILMGKGISRLEEQLGNNFPIGEHFIGFENVNFAPQLNIFFLNIY